jgi:4-hydroxythreonine-4-phosphate dehydrogenase
MTLIYTCGDPLSINIEAFLRVVVPGMARHRAVVGVGSTWQLTHQAKALGLQLPPISFVESPEAPEKPGVYWYDPMPGAPQVDARQLSDLDRGLIAKAALDAVPAKPSRPIAVLTAPINKKAISLAGFKYPGQTEFFETLWQAKAVMMLAGPELRVALATNHLPLSEVTPTITADLVLNKIKVLHAASKRLFNLASPRIAVCALNPHGGDGGLFGNQDATQITPAVSCASQEGINVKGPFPADTVFYRALKGEFDVVLAMYHDQGLGPLKTVHFDDAVNISMGLPHLRVSPDHGPAADLYLTGRASIKSFDAAAKVCERWLSGQGG